MENGYSDYIFTGKIKRLTPAKGIKSVIKFIIFTIAILFGILIILYFIGGKENRKIFENARIFTQDFTTPEGAILCIEEAYRNKDVESAVKCKDFVTEAKMMLQKLNDSLNNSEVIMKTAETLELAFRKEIENSPPDFNGIETRFLDQDKMDDLIIVNAIHKYSNGMILKEKLLTVKNKDGWRVLIPYNK